MGLDNGESLFNSDGAQIILLFIVFILAMVPTQPPI
jgi:hypothetical protein